MYVYIYIYIYDHLYTWSIIYFLFLAFYFGHMRLVTGDNCHKSLKCILILLLSVFTAVAGALVRVNIVSNIENSYLSCFPLSSYWPQTPFSRVNGQQSWKCIVYWHRPQTKVWQQEGGTTSIHRSNGTTDKWPWVTCPGSPVLGYLFQHHLFGLMQW